MSSPLISVVIPTYNEEKRIARAINSMRNQTYKNLEIIVVDDNSIDNTANVVKEICTNDSRVKYYLLPQNNEKKTNWRGYDINAGYAARNYGFRLAKGEWITTQDADDASLLNRIEVQYQLALKYKATLVTIQWIQLQSNLLDKKIDLEKITKENGEENIVIRPDYIYSLSEQTKGTFMIEPIHKFIPFPIKWFPYTRKLFYKNTICYPGADNSMFFHRKVLDDGIYFRHRNQRTWGVPSGRGSGRDFAFRVANKYKNSWSFKLPLYLWDVRLQNEDYKAYTKYII